MTTITLERHGCLHATAAMCGHNREGNSWGRGTSLSLVITFTKAIQSHSPPLLAMSLLLVVQMTTPKHGAAWVFSFNGATWSQVGAKLVGSGASGAAYQGNGVAISADAITIAVGGYVDASYTGAVWIFTLNSITGLYSQQGAKFTASPASVYFGYSVALSSNGSTLVVGADDDNGAIGAMYVFTLSGINRYSFAFVFICVHFIPKYIHVLIFIHLPCNI